MLQFFPVYAFAFILFSIFVIKWRFASSTTQKYLPPSPAKFPILGNLHQLGLYPHRSLQSMARRFGPLMLLHFGRVPVIVVSSADAAREIMKRHDLIFSNRSISAIVERLLYGRKDVSTAPYGEYWRQMRSICVLQLLSNKRVQSFSKVRREEIGLLIKNVESSALLSLPVNLSEMFSSLTSDIICRAAFGRKYSGVEGGRKFEELLSDMMKLLGSFSVGDFIPWLRWLNLVNGLDAKVEKVSKEFDKFLDEIIEEHSHGKKRQGDTGGCESIVESCEDGKDFVDVLLEIQKDNMAAGFSLDRISIKALILDMFAGGTDTTYTVLEWAMTELLRHPRIMKEVQHEVRRIVGGKQEIEQEDIDKMCYLKAVLKETLRLYPPIPLLIPRESSQDVKIKGYDISAGTMVIINAWTIGRDPTTWDEPNEFKPERFLNNSIDYKGHDFELIPFGAGRRGCPGILFAMTTNELVLARLVHKFNWSLPGGARAEDLDMNECIGIAIHRKVPLLAFATPTS